MKTEDIEKNLQTLSENGHLISPILANGIKNYLIDIDGTICDDIPNEEPERMLTAELYPDALHTLNRWYDEGNIIFFFTSRTEAHREYTEIWGGKSTAFFSGLLLFLPATLARAEFICAKRAMQSSLSMPARLTRSW